MWLFIIMNHLKEHSGGSEFVRVVKVIVFVFLSVASFDFRDGWWCGDETAFRFGIVAVDSTMLRVKSTLEDISTDPFSAEYPTYKRPVFNVCVSKFFGDCAEELKFIGLEGIMSWFFFLRFYVVIYFVGEFFDFGVFGVVRKRFCARDASLS